MTVASGVGSMPGDDAEAYTAALRVVLDELPDLPHVPELPGRGIAADMIGRTLGIIEDLAFDVQPAGWRLTGAAGIDQRRARSLLAHDLDVVEELAAGYAGAWKIQIAGPWTLAATVERPRGDRLLGDHGARRELAEALAHVLPAHLADVRRRLPGATVEVQVDEPLLPAVLAGDVPTASSYQRHRVVHPPEATELLGRVLDAARDAGAPVIVHSCARDVPVALLREAGAGGVGLDLAALGAAAYDEVGDLLDAGGRLHLGVVPAVDPAHPPGERAVIDRVERFCDMLGFSPAEISDQMVLTPSCGLAGATPDYAVAALRVLRSAAHHLSDG